MKNDIDRLYLIDRYLKGELSGPALDEFRTKLRLDPEFARETESQRAIIEGIKLARRQHLIALLKGEAQALSGESETVQKDELTGREGAEPLKEKENRTTRTGNTVPVGADIPVEKNIFAAEGKKVSIDADRDEVRYPSDGSRISKLGINYNNWYYAAAAVLFAGFFLYFIFGYYIPHRELTAGNVTDSTILDTSLEVPGKNRVAGTNETNPAIARDTGDVAIASGTVAGDSIVPEQDKKIDQSSYMVPGYVVLSKNDDGKNNNQVSTGDGGNNFQGGSVLKVAGTIVRIEFWESSVGFKGYKFSADRLLLFDVLPEDHISLTYIDNTLYMKKRGVYYKLKSSGKFEQYQEEKRPEVLSILQSE